MSQYSIPFKHLCDVSHFIKVNKKRFKDDLKFGFTFDDFASEVLMKNELEGMHAELEYCTTPEKLDELYKIYKASIIVITELISKGEVRDDETDGSWLTLATDNDVFQLAYDKTDIY